MNIEDQMNLLYWHFANDPDILAHIQLPDGANATTRIFKSRQPTGEAKDRIALCFYLSGILPTNNYLMLRHMLQVVFHVPREIQNATNNAYRLAKATYRLLHGKKLNHPLLESHITPYFQQSLGELATAEGFFSYGMLFYYDMKEEW